MEAQARWACMTSSAAKQELRASSSRIARSYDALARGTYDLIPLCGDVTRSCRVRWSSFATHDDGPVIGGRRAGTGPPVLLLHGGPGLGFDYLQDLADELAQENDVAWYQQRGLAPSATEGPFTVGADAADARRVLDELGWDRAYVVGHSWGGHLALHIATAMPERLLGVLAVDPLGAVGDGRWPEFDEEILRRTPEAVRERARELDELTTAGAADEELALEQMRLVWQAYFASPETAPPMPRLSIATERSAEMVASIFAELPALEARLPGILVPVGFVHGSRSPMPLAASTDAAERIPGAWVDVVDGAGHFTWVEAPGTVRAALRRLTGS
jgi:pimeloyl-ACP methyl ester carboxylesterase